LLRITDDDYSSEIVDYGGDRDLANILEYLEDSEWTQYFSDSTQSTFEIIIWDLQEDEYLEAYSARE
jgi:hypothetical protein